ncbi:spore germination protein [Cytobacillus sp.]|uniref:spore germination protein n=1 Tax=Cytobacillus sp. TaxID=2675269 RepID=UPI0028BE0759|nr:spore germination protein [Cytobacillus sp.]
MNIDRTNVIATLNQSLKMGKLNGNELKGMLCSYSDIYFIPINTDIDIQFFYCIGMIDSVQLNEIFNNLLLNFEHDDNLAYRSHDEDIPPIIQIDNAEEMMNKAFSGFLILYKEGMPYFYGVDLSKLPQRTPEESNTEVSIKGPKDGFTEELHVNISLIRKRIKTFDLYCESFEIGTLTQTKVALLYLKNKINIDTIDEVRKRLENLHTESVLSSGQLEQWISDRTFSLFPLLDYITRPDFAIECLLHGRFIIIVNGSPLALIGPINIFELIKSPEDVHFPFYLVAFQRILRILGLVIAIFLPGFWISLASVNMDQLPFSLLSTVVVSRAGLPFPIGLEAFIILGLFEFLREAGIRMPTVVGQTISIVGGLIIGDAAIRAGLASPTMIVIIAMTAVASYTLVNQSLVGSVSILRILVMSICIFLGIYGLFISALCILVYISRLESFKKAYLEPIASLNFKEMFSASLVNLLKQKHLPSKILQKRRKG